MAVALPSFGPEHFLEQVAARLRYLEEEAGGNGVMPVGLFLVLDEANGGDDVATELVRRLQLLDAESGNVIDFYYAGWKEAPGGNGNGGEPAFVLAQFQQFREMLRRAGVRDFGGNADLLLLDAELVAAAGDAGVPDVRLHFERAVRIDLSRLVHSGSGSLGEFLQSLIGVAEHVRAARETDPVFHISDALGLLFARESMLDFILEKFGALIGAKRLKALATRDLGPPLSGRELLGTVPGP